MIVNIEDYLHKIDAYFQDKGQKDTYMTYIMIFSIIIAFSYLLFWDSSFAGFEKTRHSVVALQQNIRTDELYLKRNPESKIVQITQAIDKINTQIIDTKDNNSYIKSKIETIASLIYDEQAWGAYLHSISKNAQKNHIKILDINNEYADHNNSFGHILNIKIESSGKFKNTLNFINSLEQSELVVDIHDLNVTAQETLQSYLDISVWGITY